MINLDLSDQELNALASMAIYWQEVRKRDDQSPLIHEMHQVCNVLGPSRLLACVELAVETVTKK